MKGRLGQPALAAPEGAFAGQKTLAEKAQLLALTP
jgi:hypothetical protein